MTHEASIRLIDFGVSAEMKVGQKRRNTFIGTPYAILPLLINGGGSESHRVCALCEWGTTHVGNHHSRFVGERSCPSRFVFSHHHMSTYLSYVLKPHVI